jgi:hypothetical protein
VNEVIKPNHRNAIGANNPVDNVLSAEKIAGTSGIREVLDRVEAGGVKIADFV